MPQNLSFSAMKLVNSKAKSTHLSNTTFSHAAWTTLRPNQLSQTFIEPEWGGTCAAGGHHKRRQVQGNIWYRTECLCLVCVLKVYQSMKLHGSWQYALQVVRRLWRKEKNEHHKRSDCFMRIVCAAEPEHHNKQTAADTVRGINNTPGHKKMVNWSEGEE
jgi:hypothetical protein